MPFVEVNGIRLMVDESGGGDPLVLVHGSWDDRHVWDQVAERLADGFRVIRYDRCGHTESDGREADTRRHDEDDLAALMERLDAAPAHVVGNSFGASLAIGLASRRPELFRSLAVHEPPLLSLARPGSLDERIGATVGDVIAMIEAGDREHAAERFVDMVLGPGAWATVPPESKATMVHNAGTFVDEQRDGAWADVDVPSLARLECPVLLTNGEESPPFFAGVISALVAAVPHAEVRVLPGTGHIPHETHPDLYAAVLREFTAAAPARR